MRIKEKNMKRIISFLLVILMLVSLIPADLAYAMEGEKLDVVPLSDGQHMIKLPEVDYTSLRSNPKLPTINPTDNPDDFYNMNIKVDIHDLVLQATGVKSVTVTVKAKLANYSQEYTVSKDKFGKAFEAPVPDTEYVPVVLVKFDDGRDSRYIVEAKSKPTNTTEINIDFLGHTGVATRWFGKGSRPDVKANFVGINKTPHLFDLPKVDQNTVLRSPSNRFQWRGHDNIVLLPVVPEADIRVGEIGSAKTIHFEIQDALQGQLAGSNYYYQITGESYTHRGFTATMREKNTVNFEAGDGTWKTAKPAQQFAANGLKLSEEFMKAPDTIGPVKVPNSESDLTPPKAEPGKPENVFKGWATTEGGAPVDMDTFVVTGDTTFHAIYGPKDQGKIKVEYKDSKTNAPIDSKYQLKDQKYPAEKSGNKDEAIKEEVFDTNKAPKFLGYKIKSITTNPVPNPPATANYTKDGDYTVIYTYDKLADIIPEKKDGKDNPDVTPEVKENYAKVTFQVATADDAKAKLQLDNKDAKSPLVYYVNPLEGKRIAEVASVKALSKDDNLYNVDANDMWTYNPDTITNTNQVISQATDSDGNVVKTEITLTAKVADKTAVKFKDKLDPQDIKVWKGDKIDWKNGVKIKDSEKDKANLEKSLKEELAKAKAKVEDLGETGTIEKPATARTSENKNLPEGKKGNLKVTFDDGSTLVVNDQTLYVADQKVEEKDPKDKDYINPDLLPKDKVKVEIKLGEGVKEAKKDGKVGNKTNPVVIKTFYIKPNTGLAAADFPSTSGDSAEIVKQANYKNPINWNTDNLTQNWNNDGVYVASAKPAVCKNPKVLQKEFEEAIDPMFENIKKKDGVYLGEYDKANKKVTVAIIDKTKPFSELKGTGLVAGIKDLLKNHNLIKYQVGNQPARDLKAIEKASGNEQELVNNLAQIVGSDIGVEINGQGSNINTLADFIDKKITLKLTVQEPDCENNPVELTYTIEGKEAISSILKGKLSPQDIKVWKGEPIDWEMGVKKDETGLTAKQIEQIKDEFSTVENGVKKAGKAKFEDATTPARDSNAVSAKPFEGNIKVKFSDGSELLVEKQNLYVSEHMTGSKNANAPEDAIEVQFLLGNGVKAKKGETEFIGAETPVVYETYKVKPNLNLDKYKLPSNQNIFESINPQVTDASKFRDVVWSPSNHVVTENNKKFTATATQSFIMKHKFRLLDKDNSNEEIAALPEVLTKKLPEVKTVAKDETYIPKELAPIKNVKEGENYYDYTFENWAPTSAMNEDRTFVGTWTREQSTSEKPIIDQPTEGDDKITGKGEPGSKVVVKDKDGKTIGETTVKEDKTWEVPVPKDKSLKKGDKVTVEQTEKGKKPNTNDTTVKGKKTPTPPTPSRPSGPSTPSKPESGRVHGKDRVETAIEISKKYFGKANTVIVVDRKDFPDAMTASVLSKLLKAPILLTDTHKLDPRVAAEIQRLGAKDVIVVGGNKSVSEAVKKELAKFDKDTVERIYGRDRYETSAQVARRVVGITGKLGHGVVASGQVFADALTVAPYASREGYPILLVRANNLPKSVKDAITELAINKVTIAGGYTTVNKSLEASLPTVVERLSGRTRYETAIDIATKKFNTNKIFLANGEYWMDALVIGPVGGILDMPILLTQANSAPQSLKDYIAKERIQKITAIGGTSMVSDRVLNELSK